MLELYYSQTCPYCKKVINYLEGNGIKYEPKDISVHKNYEILMEKGKISQVPFLIDTDNNKMMYESDKIIEYIAQLNNK